MALLNAKPKTKRVPISLRVDEALLAEIKAYNEWAAIGRVDDFFEQATLYCSGQVKIDTFLRKFFNRGVTPNPMIRHHGRWSSQTTANQRLSPTTCQG